MPRYIPLILALGLTACMPEVTSTPTTAPPVADGPTRTPITIATAGPADTSTAVPTVTLTEAGDTAQTPTAAPSSVPTGEPAQSDAATAAPPTVEPPTAEPPAERVNLLANPGFDGSHEPRANDPLTGQRIQEMWQPQGWTTYYCPQCPALRAGSGNPADMTTGRPEVAWTVPVADGGSGREFSGATLHIFLTGWVYFGGVSQVVETTPGVEYRIGAYVRSDCGLSFNEDAYSINIQDATSEDRESCHWLIKVEPFGEANGFPYNDADVTVLGQFGWEHGTFGQYVYVEVPYTAQSERTTVFFEHQITWPWLFTDGWIDEAVFK